MRKAKKDMIDKITHALKDIGDQTQHDETLPLTDKFFQVDVLMDTLRFLKDYEKNVKILNQYHQYYSDRDRRLSCQAILKDSVRL
jgi:hypothetical protein